jgi:hypothetical protein
MYRKWLKVQPVTLIRWRMSVAEITGSQIAGSLIEARKQSSWTCISTITRSSWANFARLEPFRTANSHSWNQRKPANLIKVSRCLDKMISRVPSNQLLAEESILQKCKLFEKENKGGSWPSDIKTINNCFCGNLVMISLFLFVFTSVFRSDYSDPTQI